MSDEVKMPDPKEEADILVNSLVDLLRSDRQIAESHLRFLMAGTLRAARGEICHRGHVCPTSDPVAFMEGVEFYRGELERMASEIEKG